MLPKYVLYYGKDQPPPEQIPLRAGPFRMIYENGDLRYIDQGGQEVVRRIYVAVRDRNWGTVLPRFSNVHMQIEADSFAISYDADNQQNEIDFHWHGQITGAADGAITFSMDGEARSTFWRNRIGICALHPASDERCVLIHADGSTEDSQFPALIAPTLPFRNITQMTYGVLTRQTYGELTLRFEDEIFETEDQRNWTDASYKTFGTPLSLPYPVEVVQGTRIAQSVTITFEGQPDLYQSREEIPATSRVSLQGFPIIRLPRIGLGAASHGQPLSAREIERLKTLHLSHLRVDLKLSEPNWQRTLRQNALEAAQIGVPLELALFLSDAAQAELAALRAELDTLKVDVCTWLIFHVAETVTAAHWIESARAALQSYAPDAKFGGGTNVYFNELNNNRPDVTPLELVNYSINPQVHAFDNASLVETIGALWETIFTARSFCADRLIAISPVTLKPRFNPAATSAEGPTPQGELPPQVDVRQMSLFGAVWTLGVLSKLAHSRVHSITLYETTGWRGVMETESGSPLPDQFRSIAGGVFPMYHVLADIGEFSEFTFVENPYQTRATYTTILLTADERSRFIVANLTAEIQLFKLESALEHSTLVMLDETNVEFAMRNPEAFRAQAGVPFSGDRLELKPYAIARIDYVATDQNHTGDTK